MTRIYEGSRPAPAGLLLEDYLEDVEIGLLKTGKEAEVYVIERRAAASSCLLAEKRYRDPRERAFRNDVAYRANRRLTSMRRDGGDMRMGGAAREQRAMDARSRFGKQALAAQWVGAEWATLQRLWEAGVDVPYPVSQTGDGILMQFVGDEEGAASRLADARVTKGELPSLYECARENLIRIARAGLVHADLSPYNVLVWEGRLWFIDFPQSVGVLETEEAIGFLHRDVTNLAGWFVRKGMSVDPEDLFVEVLNEVFEYRMEDMFRAK